MKHVKLFENFEDTTWPEDPRASASMKSTTPMTGTAPMEEESETLRPGDISTGDETVIVWGFAAEDVCATMLPRREAREFIAALEEHQEAIMGYYSRNKYRIRNDFNIQSATGQEGIAYIYGNMTGYEFKNAYFEPQTKDAVYHFDSRRGKAIYKDLNPNSDKLVFNLKRGMVTAIGTAGHTGAVLSMMTPADYLKSLKTDRFKYYDK